MRTAMMILAGMSGIAAVMAIVVLTPSRSGHGLLHINCTPGSHDKFRQAAFGQKLLAARQLGDQTRAFQLRQLTYGHPAPEASLKLMERAQRKEKGVP